MVGIVAVDESRKARIDELKLRISQWERVHDHEVTEIRDDNSRFKQTMKTASRVVAIGSIPSFLWVAYWIFVEGWNPIEIGSAPMFLLASFVLVVALAAAARLSGLLAHYWFRRDAKRQRVAVLLIAMAAAATVLGWIFVLTT